MKTYRIKEIFGPTIQGEGTHVGTVVCFIRFAGCNRWTGLDKDRARSICGFCDTDFRGGVAMTSQEILEEVKLKSHSTKHVVVSGGEASLQFDEPLLKTLTDAGFLLHVETNGSKDFGELEKYFFHITMSPKQSVTETKLVRCHDLKLLYPPIREDITLEAFGNFPSRARYLQPVMSENYDGHLRSTICRLYGNPQWKLSLQTHKITGVQ